MTVPEIWPGQDRGGKKRKKKEKKEKQMNSMNPIKHPLRGSLIIKITIIIIIIIRLIIIIIIRLIIIITRQVLGRPVCDRGAIPRTLVKSNVVRSRPIILVNEEIN